MRKPPTSCIGATATHGDRGGQVPGVREAVARQHTAVAWTLASARSLMDRASDYGSEGWKFESSRARMSNKYSVLSKFEPTMLCTDPYPHVVIENALDSDIADELRATFPGSNVVHSDESINNSRWSFGAHKIIGNPHISDIWQAVTAHHTSAGFWSEVRAAFGSCLERHVSKSRNQASLGANPRVGVRGALESTLCDVQLEAQISGNTPVTKLTSVRGTHLDEGNKIVSGLYYLRSDEDDSTGGDFLVQRWKRWVPRSMYSKLYFEGMNDVVETVKRVPYRHNTLVMLVDSINSLHAVSARAPTRFTRQFMNLDAVLPEHEYQIPTPNLVTRIRRRISRH